MQATSRSGQVFSRVVVPLVLFVIVVGGVAWLVQNLDNWGAKNTNQQALTQLQNLVKFSYEKAVWPAWKPEITDYLAEFEPGTEGHFDFPVENIAGQDLEAGLDHSSCTCTEVKFALLAPGTSAAPDTDKLKWTALKKTPDKGGEKIIEVDADFPSGSAGIVRLGWKGKTEFGKARLSARLWFQPKGMKQTRQYQALECSINTVPPVKFLPERMDIGSFRDQATGTILCWSATRDLTPGKDIEIDTRNIDPGFSFKIVPWDKKLEDFQSVLDGNKILSRAKGVVKIEVKIVEKSQESYLDQGHFTSTLPLLLKGDKFAHGPVISGYVHSEIRVMDLIDNKIPIGTFQAANGIEKKYVVLADPKVMMLTVVRSPKNIDVKLERTNEEGLGRWRLAITVPPNTFSFPNASAITLRSQPTRFYLAAIASTIGGGAEDDALPSIANFSSVVTSSGVGTRQVHIPVLGQVSR